MNATAAPNRLAAEPSPYLRQHAHNPVDWYPWGDEALARARSEGKPILLSIGYSACHWCHVMAHESFEDPAVAEVMNRHFVNVKVDREERPDVDQLYQGVVQLMGRGGGWPLTIFLTPDLRPFYGGTYFPPEARHGLPGFARLLEALASAWANERDELERQGDSFKQGLGELSTWGLDALSSPFVAADIVGAAQRLDHAVDRTHGGFGTRGPKFPNPMNVAVLLRGHRRTKEPRLLDGALFTLEKMAKGGVYDQLGGGFHRYSVDERWLVPHFEKMLYDNAQLVHLYSEAMQLAPRPLWQRVVEQTVGWLEREMVAPGGGFYAAQDADSDGVEGRFFVWEPAELDAVLGADAALVKARFGVTQEGNFEHGASVLELVRDDEQLSKDFELPVDDVRARLAAAQAKLLEVRSARVAPGRDDKILTGWNGLMIRGLALASRVFGRPEWARLATRAADFLLERMRRPDGRLWRSFQNGPRVDAVIEDYGDLAAGLVALYQTTFEPRFLEAAEQLADLCVELFWDDDRRAWLSAPKGRDDLLVPGYALHDTAAPSGASSLTEAQVGLAALTGRTRHLERATVYLERLRSEMLDNPLAFGHLLLAADALIDGASELALIGLPAHTAAFLELLARRFEPTVAVHCADPSKPLPKVSQEVLAGRTSTARVSAYLCHHFSCLPPIHDPAQLPALLDAARETLM